MSQGHYHQGPEPGKRAAGRAGSHQADLPVRVGQRGTTPRRRRYTGQIRRSRGIPQRQYKIRRQSKYLCVLKVTCDTGDTVASIRSVALRVVDQH